MQLREWAEKQKAKKPGKYRAQKVELDGYTFDSKAEAKRYEELKLLGKAGKIWSLFVHPSLDLGSCRYIADFAYKNGGVHRVWEDVKGFITRDCAIKIKLMHEKYGIDVMVLTEKTDPRLFR